MKKRCEPNDRECLQNKIIGLGERSFRKSYYPELQKIERIERALRENEERFRVALASSPITVFNLDRELRYTWMFNPGDGTPVEDILGKSVVDFFVPEDPDRAIAFYRGALDSGARGRAEFGVTRKGKRRTIDVTAEPLRVPAGDVIGLTCAVVDVTERKLAEEEAQAARKMQQLIINNIPEGIFWKDCRSTYLGCNNVFARAVGLAAPGDIVGKTDYDLPWSPEQTGFFRECDRRIMEQDVPEYHIIEQQREADGRLAWVETSKVPLHDAQGNVIGILGTYQDITDRKRAEEALRRSEEMLNQSQEIAHLGSWEFDLADNRLSWSDEVYRIFGMQPREFGATYETFLAAVHPEDRARVDAAYSGSIREGKDTYEIEHRVIRRSDGEVRFVHEKCEHVRDEAGRIVRSMGMVHDITERKQAEDTLKEAKVQAELYLDLMGHDINNMHQIALGYLELARDVHPDVGPNDLLEKPIEVLQRSARLIQNVRKLRKLHDGVFRTQEVDLRAVLEDVQREFGAVPDKAITLSLNGRERCSVMANELLHDVFANLVSNAIKHTGEQACIHIDLDRIKEQGCLYYRVQVEDDGPGIPDDFKGQIFNRMLEGSSKSKGMGLGLYLVKSLVESYGGRVWAEDRVMGDRTKGAKFVVMLPAIEK